jgi:uroporphyrinogen-III decarboxylase
MNRKERLMTTLRGGPVDRPAVSFYEINGLDEVAEDADPFNIYSHPSWQPLITLARERSDRIVMRHVPFNLAAPDCLAPLREVRVWEEGDSRFEHTTLHAAGRDLTQLTRRDKDVNTIWVIEHLLKDTQDLQAYLSLPEQDPACEPDVSGVLAAEETLGDSGIVMIDTADPICMAAALFDMSTYTVIATQEPALFRRLLDRFAAQLHPRTAAVAKALPGRLWRIYGPEYASPPYLRPRLFHDYVSVYDQPMIAAIQSHGGYARLHSHGNLRLILAEIAGMGASGLDPIEPPPQGDMHLCAVRESVGEQMVLFGNLEASDLENLEPNEFALKIRRAIEEGRGGRGFVLMASSCPYGRLLSQRALRNYELMVEMVEAV